MLWLKWSSLQGWRVAYNLFLQCKGSAAHLNWINSPSSAGKLLNLLLDRSNVLRLTRSPMSLGKRVKQLSFRYNAVKCSNCHSCGLIFRTLPWGKWNHFRNVQCIMGQMELTCYFYTLPCRLSPSCEVFRRHVGQLPSIVRLIFVLSRHFVKNTICNAWRWGPSLVTQ